MKRAPPNGSIRCFAPMPETKRFCAAISLSNATVSGDFCGWEEAAVDVSFQNRRASLPMPPQEPLWLDHEKRLFAGTRRSIFAHVGRLTCRRRMMSGCRRRAFAATSSDLLLARSVTVPNRRETHACTICTNEPSCGAPPWGSPCVDTTVARARRVSSGDQAMAKAGGST
jgi:hypothetical protein